MGSAGQLRLSDSDFVVTKAYCTVSSRNVVLDLSRGAQQTVL